MTDPTPTPTPEQPRTANADHPERHSWTDDEWDAYSAGYYDGMTAETQARPEQDEAVRLLRQEEPPSVKRCVTHHACDCHAWYSLGFQQARAAFATPPPATPEQDEAIRLRPVDPERHEREHVVDCDCEYVLATPPPATEERRAHPATRRITGSQGREARRPPATPAALDVDANLKVRWGFCGNCDHSPGNHGGTLPRTPGKPCYVKDCGCPGYVARLTTPEASAEDHADHVGDGNWCWDCNVTLDIDQLQQDGGQE